MDEIQTHFLAAADRWRRRKNAKLPRGKLKRPGLKAWNCWYWKCLNKLSTQTVDFVSDKEICSFRNGGLKRKHWRRRSLLYDSLPSVMPGPPHSLHLYWGAEGTRRGCEWGLSPTCLPLHVLFDNGKNSRDDLSSYCDNMGRRGLWADLKFGHF